MLDFYEKRGRKIFIGIMISLILLTTFVWFVDKF